MTCRQLGVTRVLGLHQTTCGAANLVLYSTKTRPPSMAGCVDHRSLRGGASRSVLQIAKSIAVLVIPCRGSDLNLVSECGQSPSLFCVIWGSEKKGKFSGLRGVSSQSFQESVCVGGCMCVCVCIYMCVTCVHVHM